MVLRSGCGVLCSNLEMSNNQSTKHLSRVPNFSGTPKDDIPSTENVVRDMLYG